MMLALPLSFLALALLAALAILKHVSRA